MNPYVAAIYIICLKYHCPQYDIVHNYDYFRFNFSSSNKMRKFPFSGEELKEVMTNSKIKIL